MARIRTIKPEFWTSEQVTECSMAARLLFIGIWNFADDAGRINASPKQIKALVLPSDDITADAVRGMLSELEANDLLRRYAVDGKDFFEVTGWSHQKIDKPQKPKCPAPSGVVGERSSNIPGTFIDGKEGIGEERKKSSPDGLTPKDGAPVMDAKDRLWADGPVTLESFGLPAKRARPMIGKWLRDAGDDAGLVLETIQRAERERIIDPIPWITQAIAKTADPPPLRLVNAPLLDANGNEIYEPQRPRSARAQYTDAFAAGLAEAERALGR